MKSYRYFGGGGGHYEIGLFFFWGGGGGSFLYIFRLFKVKIQNGNIFLDRKISNKFGVSLIFFFFFLGGGGGGVKQ